MSISNSHANPILGVGVESFYGAITVAIHHFLEDLLSLHLHAHTIFKLILQILVGQMDKAEEELAVRWKQVKYSILEGKVGAVYDLLRYTLHVSDEPEFFLQIWLGLLWIDKQVSLVALPGFFEHIDIENGSLHLFNPQSLNVHKLKVYICPCYLLVKVV